MIRKIIEFRERKRKKTHILVSVLWFFVYVFFFGVVLILIQPEHRDHIISTMFTHYMFVSFDELFYLFVYDCISFAKVFFVECLVIVNRIMFHENNFSLFADN